MRTLAFNYSERSVFQHSAYCLWRRHERARHGAKTEVREPRRRKRKQFFNENFMALRDEWMKKHFCSWNRNFFPKFDFVSVTRKRKNIKNYSRHLCRRKTETLIDFPNSLSFYHFLFVMQTRNTQQPSSLRSIYQRNSFQIRFPQKANASVKRRVRKRAIDINLISKLLFKSKQMYFIVKNYWQYVLRARAARCKWKKHDNARDNNESLLSHAHVV